MRRHKPPWRFCHPTPTSQKLPMIEYRTFSQFLSEHPSGADLWERELAFFRDKTPSCFGQAIVQLGLSSLNCISEAKTGRKIIVGQQPEYSDVIADFAQLPFPGRSVDGVVIPHTLEFSKEPQQVLREAHRILRGNGKVFITGFNPASLWRFSRFWNGTDLPYHSSLIALYRIKDWLSLLNFDITEGEFIVYTPLTTSDKFLAKTEFLNKAGNRWWPHLATCYALVAQKRLIPLTPKEEEIKKARKILEEAWAAGNVTVNPGRIPSSRNEADGENA